MLLAKFSSFYLAVFFSTEEGCFEQSVVIGYITVLKVNSIPTALSFPDFTSLNMGKGGG